MTTQKHELELSPADYEQRYGKPQAKRKDFTVVLSNGEIVYADWAEPYGTGEWKVGFGGGHWMRIATARLHAFSII